MRLVSDLLARGVDVLLSDIDAVWIQDPLPAVAELIAADPGLGIVASRATKWPQEQVCRCP
jgi:hypothetical protein